MLLSDLYNFFQVITRSKKQGTTARKRLNKIEAKILFFLSWCNADEFEEEIKGITEELQDVHRTYFFSTMDSQKLSVGKPTILSFPDRPVKLIATPNEQNDESQKNIKKPLIVELT